MQAITTKFLPPTNVRGSRVKATAQAGSVTLHWDHALNPEGNHRAAAMAFVRKFKWDGEWIGGGLHNGDMVWICNDARMSERFTYTDLSKAAA
jgi:hypothetical protein